MRLCRCFYVPPPPRVRLLKVSFTDIARYLGGGFNKKAVWSRFTQINRHAAAVKTIVDRGRGDPWNLEFDDAHYGKAHNDAEIEGMAHSVFFMLYPLTT